MTALRVALAVEQLRRRVPGGIGTYASGLLQGLGAHPTRVATSELRVPLPTQVVTRVWDRGLVRDWGVGDADLVHATSFAAPWRTRTPLSVFVHDVAWRAVPDAYPRRGRAWHEASLRRAVERARVVLVPSGAVAAALAEDGVEAVVTGEGADHLPRPDEAGASSLLEGLGVRGGFILSVSTLEPRKNLRRLVAAHAIAALPEPWPLVVVGPRGWGDAPPLAGCVLAGRVDDGVLAALYRRARCLVYVPLSEGWGLPPVEALHAGTPVVCSPLPSVDPSSAVIVDPEDVDAIAAAMVRAATGGAPDPASARFDTWADVAARHIDAWEAALR